MTRQEELQNVVDNDTTFLPLIKEIIYIEEQLDQLRALPKIKVHPNDPSRQKATPAAKLYKEYLQQYINAIKVLEKRANIEETEEISPLRRWLNEHMDT